MEIFVKCPLGSIGDVALSQLVGKEIPFDLGCLQGSGYEVSLRGRVVVLESVNVRPGIQFRCRVIA